MKSVRKSSSLKNTWRSWCAVIVCIRVRLKCGPRNDGSQHQIIIDFIRHSYHDGYVCFVPQMHAQRYHTMLIGYRDQLNAACWQRNDMSCARKPQNRLRWLNVEYIFDRNGEICADWRISSENLCGCATHIGRWLGFYGNHNRIGLIWGFSGKPSPGWLNKFICTSHYIWTLSYLYPFARRRWFINFDGKNKCFLVFSFLQEKALHWR